MDIKGKCGKSLSSKGEGKTKKKPLALLLSLLLSLTIMAVPAIISQLITLIYNIADT